MLPRRVSHAIVFHIDSLSTLYCTSHLTRSDVAFSYFNFGLSMSGSESDEGNDYAMLGQKPVYREWLDANHDRREFSP